MPGNALEVGLIDLSRLLTAWSARGLNRKQPLYRLMLFSELTNNGS